MFASKPSRTEAAPRAVSFGQRILFSRAAPRTLLSAWTDWLPCELPGKGYEQRGWVFSDRAGAPGLRSWGRIPLTVGHAYPFSTMTCTFSRVSVTTIPPSQTLLCPKITYIRPRPMLGQQSPGGIHSPRWGLGCGHSPSPIGHGGAPNRGPCHCYVHMLARMCLHSLVCRNLCEFLCMQ